MSKKIFSRYFFSIDQEKSKLLIKDKYELQSDIVLSGFSYTNVQYLGSIGKDTIIVFANYLDRERYGDIIKFDAKNHTAQYVFNDCNDRFNICTYDDKFLTITTHSSKKHQEYICLTQDGREYVTQDKKYFDKITKYKIELEDVKKFKNGKILQKILAHYDLGFTRLAYDIYDSKSKTSERLFTAETAQVKMLPDDKVQINYQDTEGTGNCVITDEGIPFSTHKNEEEVVSVRDILYMNGYYALIKEEAEIEEGPITNLYLMQYQNMTMEEYELLKDYFYNENQQSCDKLIYNDQLLTVLAVNLDRDPVINCRDDETISLRYSTPDAKYSVSLTENGYPITLKTNNTPVC